MRRSLYLILLLQAVNLYATTSPKLEPAKITDWLALGSGCRGRDPDLGDVKMKVLQDPKDPLRMEVSFSMGSYKLSGDKPIVSDSQSFARECSLRFAVAPHTNTRVKYVEAKTAFLVQKDKGAAAEIHSRLVIPQGTLVDWAHVSDSEKAIKNETIAMHLVPNESGKKLLSDIQCGSPKILGADFTFENQRKSFKEKVEMKHEGKNRVDFVVYLEPCK